MTDATGPADGDAGMPRWVKWFVVLGVLVLVVAAVLLLFGGDHGPGRHGSLPAAIAHVLAP